MPLGEIEEQGAAAAQVKKKDMEAFKIVRRRRDDMVHETAGQGGSHHDQEDTLEFPAHFLFSGLTAVLEFSEKVPQSLFQLGMAKSEAGLLQFVRSHPTTAQ